jgi:hypothetical protein
MFYSYFYGSIELGFSIAFEGFGKSDDYLPGDFCFRNCSSRVNGFSVGAAGGVGIGAGAAAGAGAAGGGATGTSI